MSGKDRKHTWTPKEPTLLPDGQMRPRDKVKEREHEQKLAWALEAELLKLGVPTKDALAQVEQARLRMRASYGRAYKRAS